MRGFCCPFQPFASIRIETRFQVHAARDLTGSYGEDIRWGFEPTIGLKTSDEWVLSWRTLEMDHGESFHRFRAAMCWKWPIAIKIGQWRLKLEIGFSNRNYGNFSLDLNFETGNWELLTIYALNTDENFWTLHGLVIFVSLPTFHIRILCLLFTFIWIKF